MTYLKLVTTGQIREKKKETTMSTIKSVQKLRTCTYIEMTQAAKRKHILLFKNEFKNIVVLIMIRY